MFAVPLAPVLPSSMESVQRETAMLASTLMGAQNHLGQFDQGSLNLSRAQRRLLRGLIENAPLPYMVIDPRPGLRIIEINEAYAAATLADRYDVAGEPLFEIFPDNPDLPGANGVSNLFTSIQKAAQTGQPHVMAVQRYDVRDDDGRYVRRHWRPVNTPVFDDMGRLLYVLHSAEKLTDADVSAHASLIGAKA